MLESPIIYILPIILNILAVLRYLLIRINNNVINEPSIYVIFVHEHLYE